MYIGGGLELALVCDLRIAGTKSLLGLTETGLAIIPGAGGTQRLSRLIGVAKAKELIFTASRLNSVDAQTIGVVNYSVPVGETVQKAEEIAQQIVSKGPIAIRMAKLAIDQGIQVDMQQGLEIEKICYKELIDTTDRIEGLNSFVEKRSPVYKGE